MNPPLIVIGVIGSRRTRLVVEAARAAGFSRVEAWSWCDAFLGTKTPPAGAMVRLESPSDCLDTQRLILRAGMEPLQRVGVVPLPIALVDRLVADRGEILHPRQWFFGLRELLTGISHRWRGLDVHWMSTPGSIVTMFDKVACLERWESACLPVPPRFEAVSTYDQLRSAILDLNARVFIKLRYGYSAMGAVALEWRGPLVRAITTVETVPCQGSSRLFVTKRPTTLLREVEIARLIDRLGAEEIVVERWLPKDRWNRKSYDLRLVMIAGQVSHVVGRASTTPFTNLNLDAERISREEILAHFGTHWGRVTDLAERAADCLPEAGMIGLDALVKPRREGFALLEANAFGDYLPGVFHAGESTYSAQFRCAARRGISA